MLLSPGSCLAAVQCASESTEASAVLPLGRQHGLLNMVDVLIHKLGHLVSQHLPKVLQILLCLAALVSTLLEQRDQACARRTDPSGADVARIRILTVLLFVLPVQLKAGCINPLKNLRRLGVLRVQDYFARFETYSFSAEEIDAIFEAVVWPQVCRLNQPV